MFLRNKVIHLGNGEYMANPNSLTGLKLFEMTY